MIGGLAALATSCMMQAQTAIDSVTLTNHPDRAAQGATACAIALDSTSGAGATATLNPKDIGLLVWNIHKNKHADALEDLARMASNMDLVLLQEANFENIPQAKLQQVEYWSFAPGFRTSKSLTGVMTISSVRPLAHCFMRQQEPWLRTPKAISVTEFAVYGSDQTLAVVNIHGVNFTIGSSDFEQQLDKIRVVIENHDGPIIAAGDFNTWNDGRVEKLEHLSRRLGMTELTFPVDNRVTPFSHTIDRILIRGLIVLDATTEIVDSSDHNPLAVRLAIQTEILAAI